MAKPLLGNHQRCWIWGRNVVLATLRAGRWRPYEVRFDGDAAGAGEVVRLCRSLDVDAVEAGRGELTKLVRAEGHQGFAAKMPPFPYAEADAIGDGLVVALDGVTDAFNFGAIVRSAEAFGAAGVVIPAAGQAGVTSQVARSSAGAVNGVPIARVENLAKYLTDRRSDGFGIYGASEGGRPIGKIEPPAAAVLVIGNEGTGLSEPVAAACDALVAVPIAGTVGSLNAAVAAGILIHEFAGGRGTGS